MHDHASMAKLFRITALRSHQVRYIFLVSILFILAPAPVFAQAPDALSTLIARLDDTDDEVVASALEEMGSLCDQSCIPYIADMTRHYAPKIVIAACHAAQQLANPRLAPSLIQIVQNHPQNEVRTEALNALLSIGRIEDYEQLTESILPTATDELKRLIIRRLPNELAQKYVHDFALLAKDHAYVTSIVHAYRYQPDILFQEVLNILQNDLSQAERKQLLRTLDLIATDIKQPELTHEQQVIFEQYYTKNTDTIASIQAARSTFDSLKWLIVHADQISPSTRLTILSRLTPSIRDLYTHTIFQANKEDQIHYLNYIKPWPELNDYYTGLLNASTDFLKLTKADTDNFTYKSRLAVLDKSNSDTDIQKLTDMLGHSDKEIAEEAMRIISRNPKYFNALYDVILDDDADDNTGKSWYAKWSMIKLITSHPDLANGEQRQKLVRSAESFLSTPEKLHTEAAIWMMHALNQKLPPPATDAFKAMRTDIKCAWIRSLDPDNKATVAFLELALADNTTAVRTEVLLYLLKHQDLTEHISTLDAYLQVYLLSHDIALEINTIAFVGLLQKTRFIPILIKKLDHTNSGVVYNALWTLQKLNALPKSQKLSMMYYQATDPQLKRKLGFLTGLDIYQPAPDYAFDLETGTVLGEEKIIQILRQNQSVIHQNVTIVKADQVRFVYHTNIIGLISL